MVEDPSKVAPEDRWPTMTPEQIENIRKGLRDFHKDHKQVDGIWIEEKTTEFDGIVYDYFRLEDEDGFAMIFNKKVYTEDQVVEIFKKSKETDPDWNYGKLFKTIK